MSRAKEAKRTRAQAKMNEKVIGEAVTATVTAEETAPKAAISASEFEEFGTIEVTGNFRGYWRDVPVRDEKGNAIVDESGKVTTRRQFKISRSVKLGGKIVRQAAWLSEADAKAHGLEDGVKYNLTLAVGEELVPAKDNGKDPRYADEYSFADATIVSVNSK